MYDFLSSGDPYEEVILFNEECWWVGFCLVELQYVNQLNQTLALPDKHSAPGMLWLNTLVCLVLKILSPCVASSQSGPLNLVKLQWAGIFSWKAFFFPVFLFVCSVGLVWFAQRNDKVLTARLNRTRFNEYVSMVVSGRAGWFRLIPCRFKSSQEWGSSNIAGSEKSILDGSQRPQRLPIPVSCPLYVILSGTALTPQELRSRVPWPGYEDSLKREEKGLKRGAWGEGCVRWAGGTCWKTTDILGQFFMAADCVSFIGSEATSLVSLLPAPAPSSRITQTVSRTSQNVIWGDPAPYWGPLPLKDPFLLLWAQNSTIPLRLCSWECLHGFLGISLTLTDKRASPEMGASLGC